MGIEDFIYSNFFNERINNWSTSTTPKDTGKSGKLCPEARPLVNRGIISTTNAMILCGYSWPAQRLYLEESKTVSPDKLRAMLDSTNGPVIDVTGHIVSDSELSGVPAVRDSSRIHRGREEG